MPTPALRIDRLMMARALDLAKKARFICPPNPAVGCVLVSAAGDIIGTGYTQRAGDAHAEIMALRDAAAHGHSPQGATAYITLEPCAHHGRTSPCCEALASAGVRRVLAAATDPNPLVAGRGFAYLRDAGVQVDMADEAALRATRALNIGFFRRMERGCPWVRMKTAASLDGRTALADGKSQWITGEAARLDVHNWRARACAVLTGSGTVLADDPLLNAHIDGLPRQPLLVICDSQLRTPLHAQLWSIEERRVLIAHAQRNEAREAALREKGAELLHLPAAGEDSGENVDLPALLRLLAARECNEIHLEAGARLSGAFLAADLVDELLLYQAPVLLGEGRPIAAIGPLSAITQGTRLRWLQRKEVGEDMRLRAIVCGHEDAIPASAAQ